MKQLLYSTFLIGLMVVGALPARADLSADIRAVLQNKLLQRARCGVQVVYLGKTPADASVICSINGDVPLTPASNMKLITTSAALEKLGTDFKFCTTVLLHDGDLVVCGDGDPTLGDVEMYGKLGASGWDVTTIYKAWAAQLQKLNIRTVRNVVVDDSVFDEQYAHPRWGQSEDARFAAQVGGLNLNANCVDLFIQPAGRQQAARYLLNPPTRYVTVRGSCVGGVANEPVLSRGKGSHQIMLGGQVRTNTLTSVAIHDPGLYAGTVLAETLQAAGVKVTGTVQRDRTMRVTYQRQQGDAPHSWTVVAIHETPLITAITGANKDSMNLYAECICKRLGYAATGQSGSWENGTAAAGDFLQRLGVPATRFKLDDGCGLSRHSAISASVIATVLAHDYYRPHFNIFLPTLAVAGVDGTMKDRFKGATSGLRGRVHAKTGFIEAVSALSGYLRTENNQWYAFSILLNGIPHKSNRQIKELHERIVKAVDAHAGK